jgi:hypothetical protein
VRLESQALWSGQQAVEKYLKCILLLNRIKAIHIGHDLAAALELIEKQPICLRLTSVSQQFIAYLHEFGTDRYLDKSRVVDSKHLTALDRTVWELRRFCTLDSSFAQISLKNGQVAPRVWLAGGFLESVIDERKNPARAGLLWTNGFFGKRARGRVRKQPWMHATNSPCDLNPHLFLKLKDFIFFTKSIKKRYQT